MQKILNNIIAKKKLVTIVAAIVIIVVILIVVFSSKKGGLDAQPINDPLAMVDLTMKMQADLNLQEVLISEAAGGILEVRVKIPMNVSTSSLDNGTAFLFGYLIPNISKDTEKIRVIYTEDGSDKILYEASVADINSWRSKQIDESSFSKKIKHAFIK